MSLSDQPRGDVAGSPVHVAIIMDGNGRWAAARGLSRREGHKKGIEAVRIALKAAHKSQVKYLTLYGFSSENWLRPKNEVSDLMGLLRLYLRSEITELNKNRIRLRVIGNRQKLPADIIQLITKAEEETRENTEQCLILALSYGSREEITTAMRHLGQKIATGQLRAQDITEAMIASELYTADIPDPDLILRTSGEQRLSNFLLWQAAYAELIFLNILWPDFREEDFFAAMNEYRQRERRFGQRHSPAASAPPGHETLHESGRETGRETGHATGRETGHATGRETGHATGRETGHEPGREAKNLIPSAVTGAIFGASS
ncbi:MAG: isoprenyl transferase [Candidatus Symbiobacter sp.]|nr:isoprenyl transferase [Candidatus Symbiobacter sp.]